MTTVKARVIGPRGVAGGSEGDIVELDPQRYDIPALVLARHVELISDTAVSERVAKIRAAIEPKRGVDE